MAGYTSTATSSFEIVAQVDGTIDWPALDDPSCYAGEEVTFLCQSSTPQHPDAYNVIKAQAGSALAYAPDPPLEIVPVPEPATVF